jgi:hypothetical protein
MPPYGFFVEFEARAGKEDDVEQFLREAKLLVDGEPGTLAWFAFRLGPSSFRIFEAIIARADELFATPPVITPVDVLASKLPGA